MAILHIAISRNKYEISCKDEEREGIISLAANLNKRVNMIAMSVGRLSDAVLLFLAGITIQREIDRIKKVKAGKFNDYLLNTSKKINSISVADANLGDKEERDRFFISCLNLENELRSLGGAIASNDDDVTEETLTKKVVVQANAIVNNCSNSTSEQELENILNVFEQMTDYVNNLATKINKS